MQRQTLAGKAFLTSWFSIFGVRLDLPPLFRTVSPRTLFADEIVETFCLIGCRW